MQELLVDLMPNVMSKLPVFGKSIIDTMVMVAWSGIISFAVGMVIGIGATVTKSGGILENKGVFQVLDKGINFFRSIPFIILLAGLMPVSRLIMGTGIGVKGAIVPLIFGTVSFYSRQIENALAEVSHGLVEAAQAMGSSPIEIIFRVYLKESIPAIARGTTLTVVSLVGLTAMAGAVGAGGLGDFAIRYGHDRNQMDVTYATILVLVLIVSVIQLLGSYIAKKNTH